MGEPLQHLSSGWGIPATRTYRGRGACEGSQGLFLLVAASFLTACSPSALAWCALGPGGVGRQVGQDRGLVKSQCPQSHWVHSPHLPPE